MTSLYKVDMGKVLFVTGKSELLYFWNMFLLYVQHMVIASFRIWIYSILQPFLEGTISSKYIFAQR